MYPGWVRDLIDLGLLIWLLVLSYLIYKEWIYLKKLFPEGEARDIRNKFKDVLNALEQVSKENLSLNKNIRNLSREGLKHIQKVAVLRYNPYGDTGGNMSFSVSFLDGGGNGFILTSLHSRSGTRIYTKEVMGGRSDLQLSREEEEVLGKALANE